MNTYSKEDLAKIRDLSPANSVCRVVELRHLYGDKYVTERTTHFATRDEGWEYAAELGAECNLPEYFGDAAFSPDGKKIRLLTVYGV